MRTNISNWVFSNIHNRYLIYNTCWEDPRCDRQLLELQPHSNVVMITSAGCNALDYMLDAPKQINCIDMNPRQNALMELKLATFQQSTHSDLYDMFGLGKHSQATELYHSTLRNVLPDFSKIFWDKNINFFEGKGFRKSFYYHSTSGVFAWLFTCYLKMKQSVYKKIQNIMNADTLEQQQSLYNEIEPTLANSFMQWVMNRHLVMCLLGVPDSQQKLFTTNFEKGALGFILNCVRKVFTQIPLKDNYFWRLYINGSYTPDCCPNYLRPEYFDSLKTQTNKLHTHNTTVSNFLKKSPNAYSHYVLLDHQDWLAHNNRPALEEEWKLILDNSQSGTKILLRSAAYEVNFFPNFVKEKVEFEQQKTALTHQQDRVGTYGSVYLGTVK